MAGSMREIKAKITATKKTSQITSAMHMVSASKLRNAEKLIKNYDPFLKKLESVIGYIASSKLDETHPLLVEREVKRTGYLLITSDRGLAGGYNNNLFRQFWQDTESKHKSNEDFIVGVIGTKGFSYFKSKNTELVNKEPISIRDDVQFIDVKDIVINMISQYIKGEIDELVVYYNNFKNTLTQTVEKARILPITNIETVSEINYELEPDPQAVINTLLPIYVENSIYGYTLHAKASEHASRMNAMRSATDNAKDIIDKWTLHYNRARQAAITQEITEIIGGVAALE